MKYHKYQIMKKQSAVKCFLMVVILIITFVGQNCCFAQQSKTTSYQNEENDELNISLSGSVKSLKQYLYESGANFCDTTTYIFHTNGYPEEIVKTSVFMNHKEVFIFKNGNLIAENSYINNSLVAQKKLKYDDLGRLIEYSKFMKYNDTTIETYQYNNFGKKTVFSVDNISKKNYHKWIYIYDSNGNKIEEGACEDYQGLKYFNDCIYEPTHGYQYNERGQIIKKFSIGNWSPHNTDEYYQYDEKGNKIDVKGYYIKNDTVLGFHIIYEYDEFGNQIKKETKFGYLGFDNCKYSTTKYDNNKNIIKHEQFNSNNKLINLVSIKYTYDLFGNWTKKEEFEGETEDLLKREEVIYRTIEYYE
jgi:hypothetical protein